MIDATRPKNPAIFFIELPPADKDHELQIIVAVNAGPAGGASQRLSGTE
jgi:hypothetical protein